MRVFSISKKILICGAFLCLVPSLSFASVSCPSGYVEIDEPDYMYVSAGACGSGYTALGGEHGANGNGYFVTNCISDLDAGVCTYYSEQCQPGKHFDGKVYQTCIAGSYCDGTGTATPGTSGCSKPCPENSTSGSGATQCTCNTGYNYSGGATTTTDACSANEYRVEYECGAGSGAASETVMYDSDFTPMSNICFREGYDFVGWTIDGSAVEGSFKWTYTSDKTLIAEWKFIGVECMPGTYLPAGASVCVPCLSDSYCGGGIYAPGDENQGIVSGCPADYTTIAETDAVYVVAGDSCPSGHTKLGGEYGENTIENCTTGLFAGTGLCTYYSEQCQPGKYFDGKVYQTCIAGSYCDGTGTATPGTSGCSKPCPENSTSESGATQCICNTGYNYNGGTTTTTDACSANKYRVEYECGAGSGAASETVMYDSDFTPMSDVCFREGYDFVGWTIDGSAVEGSFKWTYTSDKTLIAEWKQLFIECAAGTYLPANSTECAICRENFYCSGDVYDLGLSDLQGLTPCPYDSTSVSGAISVEQCIGSKTLHVGDDIKMNLTTVKPQTARVMVFDVLGDLYYGGLSDTPKSINKSTDKRFRILDGNTSYWLHDYTVE